MLDLANGPGGGPLESDRAPCASRPTWWKARGTGADTRTCAACIPTLPSLAPPPPRLGPRRSAGRVHPPRPPPFPACAPLLHIRAASNRPLASTTHASDLPNRCPRTRQTPAVAASFSPTLRFASSFVSLCLSTSCSGWLCFREALIVESWGVLP